jgi:enoyl-CoA hydratase
MILTGEVIDADTAESWGIAAFRADDAGAFAADLAAQLARRAPLAMRAAKAALVAERGLALDIERAGFETLLDSADKAEGIAAFRGKRKPEFTGQ